MADNLTLNAGSGGSTLATDDIGGTHYQIVKVTFGALDSSTLVTTSAGLPIDITAPNTGAAELSKAVDAASGASDVGIAPLYVRDDALTTLTPIDGDYVQGRVNANGALWVEHDGTLTISGTVTANLSATDNAVLDTIETNTDFGTVVGGGVEATALRVTLASDSTGTLSIDDGGGALTIDGTVTANAGTGTMTVDLGANNDVTIDGSSIVHAEDAVHGTGDAGIMSLTVRNDVLAALAGADGDYAPFQVNASGALYIQEGAALDVSGATVTVDGSGVTQPVSGTVTANLSATDNAVLDTIETNTDFGTVTGGGVEATALRVTLANDSTGVVSVDDGGGTLTVDGTVTANAGTGTMTVDLGANNDVTIDASSIVHAEDAAHSSGNAGVMTLAVRNDDLAALAGTDGDYAPLQVTQNGALLMCPSANDDYKYGVIDDATSGNNTLQAAVASRKIRVLAVFMVSAGTVNARFEDGAGGTALTGQMNLVANSGFTLPFNPAGWFETSVNTLLNLELSAAISVDGSFTYIEVP